jgi:hypothetical protein
MPLPPNLRFGPANPNQVTNSPFSGAVAGRGALNVVHPQDTPTFQAPVYSPLGAQQPAARTLLTALAPILGATLMGGGTGGTTATAAPTPPGGTIPAPSSWTTPGYQTNLPPTPDLGPSTATLSTNPAAGQVALLAALAGRGLRFNPSAGGSNYWKST